MKSESGLLQMDTFAQENGTLSVAEANRHIPFTIERSFFIYNLKPGDVRGNHAADYEECIFLASGRCTVMLHNGENETVYHLDTPGTGVHIPSMYWREIRDCSTDCIIIAYADRYYDSKAYIYDFPSFLQYWQKQKKHD